MSEVKTSQFNPRLKAPGQTIQFTQEQVQEMMKCMSNPVHFISEYMYIRHVDKGLIKFRPFEFQKRMLNSYVNNRFTIGLVGRQSGKSTITIGFLLWYVLFNEQKVCALLANKQALALELLDRIKVAYEELPMWMQQGVTLWNRGEIVLENGSKIMAAATSGASVRGQSFSCVTGDTNITICDDYQRIYSIDIEKANSPKYKYDEDYNIWGESMFYTVYEIRNKINNKVYVGYHQTDDLGDGYMGSGKLIKKAIEKYGVEHFEKRYLGIFDNREDAEALEAFIVNKEYTLREDTYNLSEGGNVLILHGENNGFFGKTHSEESKKSMSRLGDNLFDDDDVKIDGVVYNSLYDAKNKLELSYLRLKYKLLEPGNGYLDEDRQNGLIDFINKREEDKRNNKISTCQLLSGQRKGVKKSKEHCENISKALKGKKKTKEHSDKINKNPEKIRKTAESHRGMKRSTESRKRMSDSAKGRPSPNKGKVYCYNPKTLEKKMCDKKDVPEGWVLGFIPKELKNA